MTRIFKSLFLIISILFFQNLNAQTSITALSNTTICSGQCAALNANTVIPAVFSNSYAVTSAAYAFENYSGGTSLAIGDDNISGIINIGFPFCFFGNTFTQLVISNNGQVTFDLTQANNTNGNFRIDATLPTTIQQYGNVICGTYKDLYNVNGGTSGYYLTGVAPNRKFVAYWNDIPLFGNACITAVNKFQIVLNETSNVIDVNIEKSVPCGAGGNSDLGIVGIQNASSTVAFAPPTRNVLTSWSANNESWQFTPNGIPSYTVNWIGSDGFTASGLTAAPCPTAITSYTATMDVADCNGGVATYTSAVQVSVTPIPTVAITSNTTNVCAGTTVTLTASGATNYTLMPGGSTATITNVTPLITTTYTLTGKNGNCTDTETITITVNSSPTLTATRSPSLICGSGSSTLTATGAVSYTWNPGAIVSNTAVVSPIVSTNYTVTGVNLNGCSATKTVTVIFSPSPTITATAPLATVCAGSTATLIGSGVGITSYIWLPGAATGFSVVLTPTANTTYTVRGRNFAGCVATNTINIFVTSGVTVTPIASPSIICRGGSSTLTATGATSYTWNPGAIVSSSVIVTPTTTTVYSVTGTDVSGCTNLKTIAVNVNAPVITVTKSTNTLCIGNSATLTATGTGIVSYTWNPGSTVSNTAVVSPTTSTIYTVTATNTLGCVGTKTINLPVSVNPTVAVVSTSLIICAGNSATLTASGASTYSWNPVALTGTTIVVTPTVNTTYTVTGKNGALCTSTNTITITISPNLTITPIASSTVICNSNTATLTATGATNYTWNPGALTGSLVAVSPTVSTTYTVTGTNTLGCSATQTIDLTVSTITLTAVSNPTILCSSASATLTGTGAVTYTWNPGALVGNTVVVTPVSNTQYTVNATNIDGCTATQTLNLNVGLTPTVTASASSATVCSKSTVSLTATSVGALTYTWLPGNATGSVVVLNPSVTTVYTVQAENASGCIGTNTVLLNVNPTPTLIVLGSPASICLGGSSTITASGAFTYSWSPGGETTNSIVVTPTTTSNYIVTGTSSLNCSTSNTILLNVSSTPILTLTATSATICAGKTTTMTASGAISYIWMPGSISSSIAIVSPTANITYTVTGLNSAGCKGTETIAIVVNATPTITAVTNPTAICVGASATLTAGGGINYTWTPTGALTSTTIVTPITTTTYSVLGINALGCTATKTVQVRVNALPVLVATSNPTLLCAGASATLTGSGANTYTWMPISVTTATAIVTPTSTTVYTLSATNVNGCLNTKTLNLTVSTSPTVTATTLNNTICAGASTTLTANGANTYTWNPGTLTGSNVAVTPTVNTTYTVTGDNGVGCLATNTIAITVNPVPSLSITASSNSICNSASVGLTASGAINYTWSPVTAFTASVIDNPTVTTTYTVTADIVAGCSANQTITVNVNPTPTITLFASSLTICNGSSVTLSALGATSYTWNPLSVSGATITDSPIVTTVYTVTGADALGCTALNTITITVNSTPTITAVSNPTAICIGASATLTASGGINYTWTPTGANTATITDTPTVTTTYSVIGDDLLGCLTTQTVQLIVNALPTLTATSNPTLVCAGASATLTGSGATSYTWMPINVNTPIAIVTPTATTSYTLIGTDINVCTNSVVVNVQASPTFTVLAGASANTICAGATTTLGAFSFGAVSYTWMPINITNSIAAVSPTITTIYTVTASNLLGCTDTETVSITVNTNPTITAIASATDVCIGGSVTLSASGATSYTWNPGVLTGTTITVNPLTTTTYTVDGDNGLGCVASQTILINVIAAPSISISPSATVLCGSGSVTLTATGAVNYTWSPAISLTPTVVDNPTVTTTYTVTGDNGLGCTSNQTIKIAVNNPSVTIVSTPTAICIGSTATLTASGAITYTWLPLSVNGNSITVTPTITTTYTLNGTDFDGCAASNTFVLNVNANPTITTVASATNVCTGTTVTLTASGATSYTWNPGVLTGTIITVNPSTTTTYTVDGDNGLGCVASQTILINVVTPPIVTASVNNAITCNTLLVDLFGTSTATNSTFNWAGPNTYSSSIQNPTGIATAGDYTLTVIDLTANCTATQVVTITSNTVIPVIGIISPAPVLGCNATVTLSVITATPPALSFMWLGPLAFSSALESPTTNVAGDYSLTVTDITNGCTNTTTISITNNTVAPVYTATALAATCNGTVINSDASIIISGYLATDVYDISQAITYTGTATYNTANAIGFGGVLTNTLTSPIIITPYTIRVFGLNGCFKDTTVSLNPTVCNLPVNVIGMTKAVGTPTFINNNAYNITYTITATNTSTNNITSFIIGDDLTATFPLPTTFSVISAPIITSLNSGLVANALFNGVTDIQITTTTLSTLLANKRDTVVFTVQVNPHGNFGPFNNSATGFGIDLVNNISQADTSNDGFIWDTDGDGDATNNNVPTPVSFTPNSNLGIAKFGKVSEPLDDKSVDVTYVFTIVNYGNDTLKNIQAIDTLLIAKPAIFTIKTSPVASGLLVTNSLYNGTSDINLLNAPLSQLAPGAIETITLVVNVKPDTLTTIKNSAVLFGIGSLGNLAIDTSNTGYDPDPNTNTNASDVGEDAVTIVKLPNLDLFIPEVFTPDGDGKNDVFFIKGIVGRDVKLTVFNRWGNKVYQSVAYDNTWNGTPNVSDLIIGNNKLPQGTYYFVAEFADGKNEPINGYVVLQY